MKRSDRYDEAARRRIAAHPMAPPHVRLAYLVIAYVATALGVAGVFLPLMPGVPFLLIAIWAAPKGSPRVHDWIYAQPKLARMLDEWYAERVVPLYAKCIATAMMAASLGWLLWRDAHWALPASLGLLFASIATYLWTRPSVSRHPGGEVTARAPADGARAPGSD